MQQRGRHSRSHRPRRSGGELVILVGVAFMIIKEGKSEWSGGGGTGAVDPWM